MPLATYIKSNQNLVDLVSEPKKEVGDDVCGPNSKVHMCYTVHTQIVECSLPFNSPRSPNKYILFVEMLNAIINKPDV